MGLVTNLNQKLNDMKIFLLPILCLISLTCFAGLSPSETTVFCPKTNYQFTYTTSGEVINPYLGNKVDVEGYIAGNSYNSSTNITTLTIIMNFNDVATNNSATLIYYVPNNVDSYNYSMLFPNVKSLYQFSKNVTPNISEFKLDSCSSSIKTISFLNLKFINKTTSVEFADIVDYLYTIPMGWKIDGQIATSQNQQFENDNIAIIESDNIHEGVITIRPINLCASNLNVGGSAKTIPIVRTKPSLAFESVTEICSSSNFQANNVPIWVTNYNWTLSPSNIFTFSNATTNPTTISLQNNGQAQIGLTISGSGCPSPFYYNTQEIIGASELVGGTPTISSNLMLYSGPGDENEICFNQETYLPVITSGASSYPTWSHVSHVGSPQPSWNGTNSDLYVYFFNSRQTSLVLNVAASNGCGTTSYQFGFKPVDCNMMKVASINFTISPNPTKGNITINRKSTIGISKSTTGLGITGVFVYDLNNSFKMSSTFNYTVSANINIGKLQPGTYVVVIKYETGSESQQVILK